MIKPISDRQIKIYRVDPNKTLSERKKLIFFYLFIIFLEQLQSELNENNENKLEFLDQEDPEIKKAIMAASKVKKKYFFLFL